MTTLSPFGRAAAAIAAGRRRLMLGGVAAVIAVAAGGPLLIGKAPAQTADPVVARVNGVEVRASDLALAEEDVGSNLPAMPSEGKREYLTTFVGDMILVAKAAEGKKLAEGDEFKRRLAYQRNKILMEMLLASESKAAITDTALRALYEDAKKQMSGEEEVRARHILVESEAEAKAVLADIRKGGDFGELAKAKSKDPGAQEGGDLGYFTKDQMVPEFSEVAFKLDKGQLSEPVKTQFGWHIIKVEDKRTRAIPEFDKVRDQLESYLTRRAQAELITKLRAEARVERVPDPAAKPAEPPKK